MSALREDQVQRYSRQILLKEVGGRGQRALLEGAFEVVGVGPALDVAVAYLAASGTPVKTQGSHAGFLAGVLLEAFSPDAVRPGAMVGWLGPLEALLEAPIERHRVAIGRGVVVGLRAGTSAGAIPTAESDAEPVTQGALAALLAQRWVLGFETQPRVEVVFQADRWSRRG
jgi:hypothetical protein